MDKKNYKIEEEYNSHEVTIREGAEEVYLSLLKLQNEKVLFNGCNGRDISNEIKGKMFYKKDGSNIDYFISAVKLPRKLELTFFSKGDVKLKVEETENLINRKLN
jgi:hypothetical protein